MNLTGLFIVCIGAAAAFIFPFLLTQFLRRRGQTGWVQTLRRAADQSRHPWKQEEDALAELSRRVAELKKENPDG
jgi:cell division protein FtsB